MNQAWWYMPIISERWRQEDQKLVFFSYLCSEFEAILGYMKPYLGGGGLESTVTQMAQHYSLWCLVELTGFQQA